MNRLNTTNKQSGFTLIELSIVVGIIGILAAIAVPAYHKTYVNKTKFTEVMKLTGPLKSAVESCFIVKATVSACFANNTKFAHYQFENAKFGNFIEKLELGDSVDPDGTSATNISQLQPQIVATATADLKSTTFILNGEVTAAGSIRWTKAGTCEERNWC